MARAAEKMPIRPIVLGQVLRDWGIRKQEVSRDLRISATTIGAACRTGWTPGLTEKAKAAFRRSIEDYLRERGVDEELIAEIWEEAEASGKAGIAKHTDIIEWEVEMLKHETLKHFKLFRNPFQNDVRDRKDVYLSQDHRYVQEAMLDAAMNGGFVAVVGEVGSGKTVMRELVFEQLQRDERVVVVFPQTIDKRRLTAYGICQAIIRDVSADGGAPSSSELQASAVKRLLMEQHKTGRRFVLVIEEAHDLHVQTLRYLKRFLEIRDGLAPVMGVILVAQPEFKERLDERRSYQIREVIRRCAIAELKPFGQEDVAGYLALKFKRVGAELSAVVDAEGISALCERLLSRDRSGKITDCRAYPLTLNNYLARAMNLAAEMGEPKVNVEVVAAI